MNISKKITGYFLGALLLLFSHFAQATPIDPAIQKRINAGSKQLQALLQQNAWNNAHGLSHKNRYVIGDLDWITVNDGAIKDEAAKAINKLLIAYNQNPNKAYRYNAVKLYLYLGGMQGFKVVKPDKNETLGQMMARLKKRKDRNLYGYEQYKAAIKRESAILRGILKKAPPAFRDAQYNLLAGLSAYLDVYPPNIAKTKDETLILGIHGLVSNTKLRKTNQAIIQILRSQMKPYMQDIISMPKVISQEAGQKHRAQGVKQLVKMLTIELGNYHPTQNPAKINFDAELPQLITASYTTKNVKALEKRTSTSPQREADGKVEVWNYTGMASKGFAWQPSAEDKIRSQFVRKIKLVITNAQTPQKIIFDISNRRADFSVGVDEMLFWVHYTTANQLRAEYWFSSAVEANLQKFKADRGMRAAFTRLMEEGINRMGKTLTEVSAGVYYVTKFMTEALKAGQIPAWVWNPKDPQYNKAFGWVISILMYDYANLGIATRYFALSCGLWNGALKTVGDLTGLLSMFTGYISQPKLRAQMDQMFKGLKEKGFLNVLSTQFMKHSYSLMELEHKAFYLLGEDVVFLLSMATGAGELGVFAKLGKLGKIQQGLGTFVKGAKASINATQKGLLTLRQNLKSVVKLSYQKATQSYDLIASGKIIATYQAGVLKVKRWVDISGGKGKKLLTESLDDSPDGKFIAQTKEGQIGICKANGKGGFLFETEGIQTILRAEDITRLKKIKWKETSDALELFIHAEGSQHFAYLENTLGKLQKINIQTEDLARIIRTIDPSGNKPVRLLSCSDLNAAKSLSRSLGKRPLYATEDLVRVHRDGGITTVARSGTKTQKWRKLQQGKEIANAPTPKKPKAKFKDDFVEMGLFGGFKSKLQKIVDKDIVAKLSKGELKNLKALDNISLETLRGKPLETIQEVTKRLQADDPHIVYIMQYRPYYSVNDINKQIRRIANRKSDMLAKSLDDLMKHIQTGAIVKKSGNDVFYSLTIGNMTIESRVRSFKNPYGSGNIVNTTVKGPGFTGDFSEGVFERVFNLAPEPHIVLKSAFRHNAPPVIPHPVKLVGDGLPLATYITLMQSKLAGFNLADLKFVRLSQVVNEQTLGELGMLMKRYPNTPIDDLIKHTHSYTYSLTLIEQIGKKSASVDKINKVLMSGIDPKILPNKQLMTAYGFNPNDKMPLEIDVITIRVE